MMLVLWIFYVFFNGVNGKLVVEFLVSGAGFLELLTEHHGRDVRGFFVEAIVKGEQLGLVDNEGLQGVVGGQGLHE